MSVKIVDRDAIDALERIRDRANGSIRRGLYKAGLLVGRTISENVISFMVTAGTHRLARSFLAPQVEGTDTVILGRGAPVYAAIHEYGGIIKPVRAKVLAFEIDGQMVFTKQVEIREKRYVRDALQESQSKAADILGLEIANEFAGEAS